MKPAPAHVHRHPVVSLHPYRKKYLELYIRWRHQPATARHNPLASLSAKEMNRQLKAHGSNLSHLRRHKAFRWFVEHDGVIVGSVSLKNINHRMGYAEIGYGFDQEHHGRGLATAAVGLLVDQIFTATELRKLLAFVHDENHASCRVLEKLGFQREGFLREHYVIAGKPVNEVLFALLKRDWKERQAARAAAGHSH